MAGTSRMSVEKVLNRHSCSQSPSGGPEYDIVAIVRDNEGAQRWANWGWRTYPNGATTHFLFLSKKEEWVEESLKGDGRYPARERLEVSIVGVYKDPVREIYDESRGLTSIERFMMKRLAAIEIV